MADEFSIDGFLNELGLVVMGKIEEEVPDDQIPEVLRRLEEVSEQIIVGLHKESRDGPL